MDNSTPSFPVLHYLPEFTQTRVHWVGDAWGRRESSVTQILDWCLRVTRTHIRENTVHAYVSHMHTQCLIHWYFPGGNPWLSTWGSTLFWRIKSSVNLVPHFTSLIALNGVFCVYSPVLEGRTERWVSNTQQEMLHCFKSALIHYPLIFPNKRLPDKAAKDSEWNKWHHPQDKGCKENDIC